MPTKEPISRHERRRLKTRKLLKQTAVDLILENGYEAVTVQDITDTADLGRGTFYIHFKDKEDIMWAIVKDQIDELQAYFFDIVGIEVIEGDFFLKMWTHLFTYIRENSEILLIGIGEQGYAPLAHHVHQHIANMLEKHMSSGRVHMPFDVPYDFLARYMAGAMLNLMHWWVSDLDRYTPEEMATMFYKVTFGPLADKA